jgi:hypothetical protein
MSIGTGSGTLMTANIGGHRDVRRLMPATAFNG